MKLFVAVLLLAVLVEYGQAKRSIWWKKNAKPSGGGGKGGYDSEFENKVLSCLADIKEDTKFLKSEMQKLMSKVGRLVQGSTAFISFENHTYSIVKAESNWEEAKKACEEIGEKAHLLIIDSVDEMNFIREQLDISEAIYWIGMTDAEVEDQWKWTDGTALAEDIAAFWFQGNSDGSSVQPNGGTDQNCGQLRSEYSNNAGALERADNNYLNDFYCDLEGFSAFRICEVDAPIDTVYAYYYSD